jgi:hypothetical protein
MDTKEFFEKYDRAESEVKKKIDTLDVGEEIEKFFCGSCSCEIEVTDKEVGLCDECGYELAK